MVVISKQLQFTWAIPTSAQQLESDERDTPLFREKSYVITIAILGSSIFLLFIAKWLYVSRRRIRHRKGTVRSQKLASMWRDDFSGSSLHVWGKGLSNKERPHKSAFFVGLFGSPSWETRYSAIVDKVTGNDFLAPRQDRTHPVNYLRAKSASEKSVAHTSMSSPIFRSKSRVNSVTHRPTTSFMENIEIAIPSPAMESLDIGKTRSRRSEQEPNGRDYVAWKTNLLSGSHTSYPTGLCIDNRTKSWSPKSKKPATFLPSIPPGGQNISAPLKVLRAGYSAQLEPQSQNPDGVETSHEQPREKFEPKESTEPPLNATTHGHAQEIRSSGIDNILANDSSLLQNQKFFSVPDHPYSHTGQHPVASDLDEEQTLLPLSFGDPEAFYLDYHHGSELTTIPLAVRVRPRASPPRESQSCVRRVSPKVGPSPLRRMFLPLDLPNEIQGVPSLLTGEQEEMSDGRKQPWGISVSPFQSPHDAIWDSDRTRSLESPSREIRPMAGRFNLSDNLVEFLDQLVQETSEWDADLFVDDNFKAMIDHSKSFETSPHTPRFGHMVKKSTLSRNRRVSFRRLEDIPEVDVTELLSSDDGVNKSYWSDEDCLQRNSEVGIAH